MWNLMKRMPPPHVPYALVATIRMGQPRIKKVPEAQVPWYRRQSWEVLAMDSDVPIVLAEGQSFDEEFFAKVASVQPPPESQEDGA